MKKVVYISWMSLVEEVERDWYISHLVDQGVQVEYWDVTPLLFPGVKFQTSLDREYLRRISNYGQLRSLLQGGDTSRTNFVSMVNFEPRFRTLYRLLTKYGCHLFFVESGNFPIKGRSKRGTYAAKLRHPAKLAKEIWQKTTCAVYRKLGLIKSFDVVFAGGYASMEMHKNVSRVVHINLFDYDNFLLAQGQSERVVEGRYCVFLDNNLPFHSDMKVAGLDYLEPTAYGRSLNRFFALIEERYQVKTVIAAHPKAEYDDSYFEGRLVLKGVTRELVKNAEFVLSHHSTSISYAILARKPLVFIYTDGMAKIYRDSIVSWISDFAEYLKAPVYNVDELATVQDVVVPQPDLQRYDLYKYNYLTTKESEHMLTRDIFFAEITAE